MKFVNLESGNQAHFNTIDTDTFNKFLSGTDDDEDTQDGDDAHSDVLLNLTGTITQNMLLT